LIYIVLYLHVCTYTDTDTCMYVPTEKGCFLGSPAKIAFCEEDLITSPANIVCIYWTQAIESWQTNE